MSTSNDQSDRARAELRDLAKGQGALDTHLSGEYGQPPQIDENDPAEVWGRRFGRGLAFIAGGFALYWLIETYLR